MNKIICIALSAIFLAFFGTQITTAQETKPAPGPEDAVNKRFEKLEKGLGDTKKVAGGARKTANVALRKSGSAAKKAELVENAFNRYIDDQKKLDVHQDSDIQKAQTAADGAGKKAGTAQDAADVANTKSLLAFCLAVLALVVAFGALVTAFVRGGQRASRVDSPEMPEGRAVTFAPATAPPAELPGDDDNKEPNPFEDENHTIVVARAPGRHAQTSPIPPPRPTVVNK